MQPSRTYYSNGRMYRPRYGWSGKSYPENRINKTEKLEIERDSIERSERQVSRDIIEKESAEIYRRIANECLPSSIRMVEDVPSKHSTGKLPILDTVM